MRNVPHFLGHLVLSLFDLISAFIMRQIFIYIRGKGTCGV